MSLSAEAAREELARLVRESPQPFPYDRAALLLAADEYPRLAVEPFEEQLAEYARQVEAASGGSDEPIARLSALRRLLYEEEGFHGDRESYYDTRNSYLNEVLLRKLGIPISLATVVLGVARRLGWPLHPVNFPSHFLLRYDAPGEPLALDPFDGLILGHEELEERWRLTTGADAPGVERMLAPAEPRAVLLRMLNNIRLVHANARRYGLAARANEKMVLVDPANPMHERDLGYLLMAAGDTEAAASHLERYLSAVEPSPEAEEARRHLRGLRQEPEV